jgi:hypothetical protein
MYSTRVRIVILHCSHPVTAGLQYIWTRYIVSAWELPWQFPETPYTRTVTTYYTEIPHTGPIESSLVISECKRNLTPFSISLCYLQKKIVAVSTQTIGLRHAVTTAVAMSSSQSSLSGSGVTSL